MLAGWVGVAPKGPMLHEVNPPAAQQPRLMHSPITLSLTGALAVTMAGALAGGLVFTITGCSNSAPLRTELIAGVPSPIAAEPYKIGSDDILDVLVWKQPQLSAEKIVVGNDGTIALPLTGRVTAAGITTEELQAGLTNRLSNYIHDPKVTVRVASAASRVVYVAGEVAKPGVYPLLSGEVVSQAIATAGGPTVYASLGKVRVTRRSTDTPVVMTVNLNAAQAGDLRADVPLERGDEIYVP